MRIHKLDESLECICHHKYSEHRHTRVVNIEYMTYPLTVNGFLALECEHIDVPSTYFKQKSPADYCECNNFKPIAKSVQKLVKVWVKTHGR